MAPTRIKFIPPQMDRLAGTSTVASRKNPINLLLRDCWVLIRMIRYLPLIVIPFRTDDSQAELYCNVEGMRDIALQSWLFLMEVTLLFMLPVTLFCLPGGAIIMVSALSYLAISIISWPMQGPRIVHSHMDAATTEIAKDHGDERWLFINGCITGHRGLQLNVNRLAKTFGRPITGIHNQTYGLVADLIECLIQRCLSYKSMDVRVAYDYTKACLLDPTVSKVVLIGHSQGGLIASLVLDSLFADLPCEVISKLEVYTFGSAASHFSNPHLSQPKAAASYCIPHIEHYVNELDLIPRWGVLYNVVQVLDNKYSGKIFVRMGTSGHLLNQHYLDPMFPLERAAAGSFLDQVVDVDEKLAERRESVAARHVAFMRRESAQQSTNGGTIDWGDGSTIPVGIIVNGEEKAGDMAINFVEPRTFHEARGKTVRQLSRLWRYTDGGSPVG